MSLCTVCKGSGCKPEPGGVCDGCSGWGVEGGKLVEAGEDPPVISEADAVALLRAAVGEFAVSGTGTVTPPEPSGGNNG